VNAPHKASFSKGQKVNLLLLRRAGNSEHLIGKAGDTTVIVCAGSRFKKPEPAIKAFFALEEKWWKQGHLVAEIVKEAHQEDLDYVATAAPFDQQSMMMQYRISKGLSQAHGGKIVPFKPKQSELVAQPEEPLKKTQFMITKSLDLKIKAMSFDPMVLAKLGVTEKQARTAILTKGLEFAIEWLEGGGEIEPVVVEQVKTDPVEAFYEERLASALATPEQLAQGEENHQLASLLTGRAGQLGISKRDLMCMMLNDYIYSNSSKGFWKLGEES
jgi:hypothetical protein